MQGLLQALANAVPGRAARGGQEASGIRPPERTLQGIAGGIHGYKNPVAVFGRIQSLWRVRASAATLRIVIAGEQQGVYIVWEGRFIWNRHALCEHLAVNSSVDL